MDSGGCVGGGFYKGQPFLGAVELNRGHVIAIRNGVIGGERLHRKASGLLQAKIECGNRGRIIR